MKKVITYGTFDLFHKGHYNILKRAKEYGDYLIVGVTGETYDIERGKLNVHDSLATRIENVKKTGFADEIIVEEYLGQKIGDILKFGIDFFVIGDDWKGKFDHLSRYCNVVYLERTKGISSTQIREDKFISYNIGVVFDLDDNQIINESKLINNFHVKNIFCKDKKILDNFQENYSVDRICESYEQLIEYSDIIFVRCSIDQRFDYIVQALKSKKHVIYDPPATFNSEQFKLLLNLAKENDVILMGNIKMVYISIFNQLLWMVQGGLLGDILNFNCSVSKNDLNRFNLFYELSASSILVMLKIMGLNYEKFDFKVTKYNGNIEFATMNFVYPTGYAMINVGNKVRVDNQLEIIGTEGTIRMKGDWWRGKNFELYTPDTNDVQIYNTNFEGNGFKYLLKAMLTMLSNNDIKSMGVFKDESIKIIEILEQVSNEIY